MDRQCSSCGGFCKKSGCERENITPPQPEPEPVAWISDNAGLYHGKPPESLNPLPLYLTPPQREWQGLTDEEAAELCHSPIAVIEAKLKEKNAADA
jgi:hypothetical protein